MSRRLKELKISFSSGITEIRHSFIFYLLCHKPPLPFSTAAEFRSFVVAIGQKKREVFECISETGHHRMITNIRPKMFCSPLNAIAYFQLLLYMCVYVMVDYKCCRSFSISFKLQSGMESISLLPQLHRMNALRMHT